MNGAYNSTIFQLQSPFQRFSYQTLCVFSQIKDILNGIIILSPGSSCPRGGTFGSKINFSKHGHVAYQIERDVE